MLTNDANSNALEVSDGLLEGIGESLKRFGGSRKLLQQVLDTIPQAVFWKDADLVYLGCNKLFVQLAGKPSPADVLGLTDFDMPWDKDEAEFYRMCDRRVMDSGEAEIGIIESQINAEGELTWLETNKVPLHNDQGEVIGILGTFHDITRLKQAEETLQRNNEELERRVEERTRELEFVANHDGLTGLANRGYFVKQLNAVLNSNVDENIALMFLDLDNFKPVNDSGGHEVGDQLLVQVSSILRSVLGADDLVGRFGGDEFLVLMRDLDSQFTLARAVEEIRRRLQAQVQIGEKKLAMTASVGIVYCNTRDYQSCDDLLNDADLAMYSAKSSGKNGFTLFSEAMRDSVNFESNVRKQILEGINGGQFLLHFQPIIDQKNGCITGFEGLVRWQHPERGLVYPGDFILVAESSGMIVPLGQQVLEYACQQLSVWRDELGEIADRITISVNLSPHQLSDQGFVESLKRTVKRYNVEPRCLNLEITESVLLENRRTAVNVLQELRELGFRIHLDDFGTGYSSLSYVDELPVDGLKIDRSFVEKFESDRSNNVVVQMILALADALNVGVVAEGVENQFQADVLKVMGCDLIQGYHFAKPMSADDATEYLIKHHCSDSLLNDKAPCHGSEKQIEFNLRS